MKRWIILILSTLLLLVAAILIGGPYYAKHYIEKNSLDLVGRKVQMERLHFNALTGHLLVTDFNFYEVNESDVFVQFDTLFVNLTIYKLLGGQLLTEALHLKGLDVNVSKENDKFSFHDLIPKKDSTNADTLANKNESFIKKITLLDIQILHGDIVYGDRDLKTDHNLKDINIILPGITIGDEKTQAGLEFAFAKGGTFKTNLDYNMQERSFEWKIQIEQLDLSPFLPYAQPHVNMSKLQGWFSGDVLFKGDFDEISKPIISGSMNLNDLSVTDNDGVELLKLSSLFMDAKELNIGTGKYHFGSLQFNRPEVHGVIYKQGDNLRNFVIKKEHLPDSALVAKDESNKKPFNYLLEEFRLNHGVLMIDDKNVANGPFEYLISDINFSANNLTEGQQVTFDLKALMNNKGTLEGHVVTDPGNPSNGGTFDLDLENLPIADFSPYMLNSTAYPITSGRLTFQTKNKVASQHLNSHLVLNLYNTELGDKRKDIDAPVKAPLKLGLVVLEDTQGRINIDVPAEGDISDPEFRYSKLVWKVILNVLIKAAASPYNLLAGAVGAEEDDIKFIRMEQLEDELGPEQTTQLDLIARLLEQKEGLSAKATLVLDIEHEEKVVREYLAKRAYYLQKNHGSDSAKIVLHRVDKIKIMAIDNDAALKKFLEKKTGTEAGLESLSGLIDLYLQESDIKQAHLAILKNRLSAVKNYMMSKQLGDRFMVNETWSDDKSYNRPRFELTYEVN